MNSTVFTSSRYLFAGAKHGIMPAAFKCVHPRSMSPRAAVIVGVCVAMAISFIGNLEDLLTYMTYAIWMQRTLVQIALIYMRYKRFGVPKTAIQNPIFIPGLFLLVCILLLVVPVKNEYKVGVYAIGFVIVGFLVYFVFIFPKKLPSFLTKLNQKGIEITRVLLNSAPIDADDDLDDDLTTRIDTLDYGTTKLSKFESSWE